MFKSKKAEWRMKDFVLAMLLFSAVFGLMMIYIVDMATEYDTPTIINGEYNATFNKFSETSGEVNNQWEKTRGGEGETSSGVLRSTWDAVTSVWDLVTISRNQISGLGEIIGIPRIVSNIVLTLIFLTLVIGLVWLIINFFSPGGNKV